MQRPFDRQRTKCFKFLHSFDMLKETSFENMQKSNSCFFFQFAVCRILILQQAIKVNATAAVAAYFVKIQEYADNL